MRPMFALFLFINLDYVCCYFFWMIFCDRYVNFSVEMDRSKSKVP